MKALILAAGYATRLYPLTRTTPKPLLDINGKPILERILDCVLEVEAVDEVIVVTNQKFFPHFVKWEQSRRWPVKILVVNDLTMSNEDRLGSLGDIQFVLDKLQLQDDCFVIAGDNLFTFSLRRMVELFRRRKAPVVGLYDVKDIELAKLYGIVEIDAHGKIIGFEEKPKTPKSTLSSTGVYLYPKETLHLLNGFLKSHGKSDKAGDFLEWLHKKQDVYGLVTTEPWYDIGSIEQLEIARREFS